MLFNNVFMSSHEPGSLTRLWFFNEADALNTLSPYMTDNTGRVVIKKGHYQIEECLTRAGWTVILLRRL